ncbi:tetratricopeptide repeat protein [Sphingomonas flavalba]|uniref:tetratricopeptide repeat protein n=1 Tax=Sphingomonas flavalba TaxID=2559804 RepID=UPI00109D8A30|nr:tetratricopeptide repeat protein [Sphingomonas flavalba]
MALTPSDNQAFIREVDEELRRDQLARFGKTYGIALGAAILIGLLLFGGYLWYRNYDAGRAGLQGDELATALATLGANKVDEAKPKLEALAKSDRPGYSAAARLALADIALQKDDTKGAAAQYKAIAEDSGIGQPFRDLALVRQTAAEYDVLPPETVISRLKGLAVPGNPWFGSAGEMVAAAYVRANKPKEAGALFGKIAADAGVPASIRSRAVQMAGVLGVDAVDAAKESVAK